MYCRQMAMLPDQPMQQEATEVEIEPQPIRNLYNQKDKFSMHKKGKQLLPIMPMLVRQWNQK